jgi:hypothetical protein
MNVFVPLGRTCKPKPVTWVFHTIIYPTVPTSAFVGIANPSTVDLLNRNRFSVIVRPPFRLPYNRKWNGS